MPRQLVIQLARFGDLLQTARLIDSLCAQGETHLLTDRSLTALAALIYPGVHVHAVPAHGGEPEEVLSQSWRTLAELRQVNWDAVYNLNHSGMNRALGAMFPPETQRGHLRRDGQSLRERWVQMAFRRMQNRRSASLNLEDFWGVLAPNPIEPPKVNPVAVPGGRGLGVVLAGRHSRRSLPPDILAPCIRILCEQLDGPEVFLLGTAAEKSAARRLLRCLPPALAGKIRDLTGRTDWAGLVEALTGLDALFTPDTGTMHLAARLGVPVRALFLSSAWAWETGPYGLGHTVWQVALPCAPCLESADCDGGRCRELFAGRQLLRSLAGRPDDTTDLQVLHSGFDSLGLIWKGPETPESPLRATTRRLLIDYLGMPLPETAEERPEQVRAMADSLYQEADWMLPDVLV